MGNNPDLREKKKNNRNRKERKGKDKKCTIVQYIMTLEKIDKELEETGRKKKLGEGFNSRKVSETSFLSIIIKQIG